MSHRMPSGPLAHTSGPLHHLWVLFQHQAQLCMVMVGIFLSSALDSELLQGRGLFLLFLETAFSSPAGAMLGRLVPAVGS